MRIEFLTQEDPLYILPFFEEFLRSYASDFEILHISTSPTMGKRSRLQMLKELTSLYGPAGMTRLLSTTALSKILSGVPRSRGASGFYSVGQIAAAYGISHRAIGNPNAPEFVAAVRQRQADVLVSVACPFILKAELLSIPPCGCVNIHHAPLPRYKGMMPTFWQLYHGETSVGVTVHTMGAKIDEGVALLQDSLDVKPNESLHALIRRSKRHGAHCMARALKQLATGSETRLPLNGEGGSYFTFPTRKEIQEFQRRGHRGI